MAFLFYSGAVLDIYYADDEAERSRSAAAGEREDAKMEALIERFANIGTLRNPKQINCESFQNKPTKIYAIKAGNLRAYGFNASIEVESRSERHSKTSRKLNRKSKRVFVISHFKKKKRQKLKKADYEKAMKKRHSWFEQRGRKNG